jgi:3-hydroxyisobutyrate dehydrogenase-like beta-hydroxyacid dehydrogenase
MQQAPVTVGFIGLGIMGIPMAKNILKGAWGRLSALFRRFSQLLSFSRAVRRPRARVFRFVGTNAVSAVCVDGLDSSPSLLCDK